MDSSNIYVISFSNLNSDGNLSIIYNAECWSFFKPVHKKFAYITIRIPHDCSLVTTITSIKLASIIVVIVIAITVPNVACYTGSILCSYWNTENCFKKLSKMKQKLFSDRIGFWKGLPAARVTPRQKIATQVFILNV